MTRIVTDTTLHKVPMLRYYQVVLLLLLIVSPLIEASNLTIRVIDQQSKMLVPARIELLGDSGETVVAQNAVPLTRECVFVPMPEWLRQTPPKEIANPFSGTTQHYIDGVGHYLEIEPGRYSLRVFSGPEYRVSEVNVELRKGESKDVHVTLERVYDAPQRGWLGADDHLHLARLIPGQNESLGHWMSAEELHIANLMQMGSLTQFGIAPQYAFGDAGAVRSSDVLLLSGQEHPQTHMFGHALTIGATAPIDERQEYTLYDPTFAKAKTLDGISGFAHWGIGPASYGLAISLPKGNVEFLEVLNFEYPSYELWYQLLNLGFPLAATAGTDFPCLSNMPGRERFYTKIEGQPSRVSFIEGIREQRTFVTNGPMLSLTNDGMDIGSRKTLFEPRQVTVIAEVVADTKQCRLTVIELIQNGRVISAWPSAGTLTQRINLEVFVNEPSWFAIRVSGEKIGETVPSSVDSSLWIQAAYTNWINGAGGPEYDRYLAERTVRESAAHTSPIYFDFIDDPGLTYLTPNESRWLDRLDELEKLLTDGLFDKRLIPDWLPYSDGISAQHLRDNTPALLEAIAHARQVFQARLEEE